jgi:hypothetical protein
MVNLGSLGGAATPTPSGANGVNHHIVNNNTIYVAGWSNTVSGVRHAVLWTVTIGFRQR